jgi:hypothetical protein
LILKVIFKAWFSYFSGFRSKSTFSAKEYSDRMGPILEKILFL